MIIPYGKLVMINSFVIITDFGLAFMKNGLYPQEYLFLPCCILGIYFLLFKKKYYVLIGYILTYFWLYYVIEYKSLINNSSVSISLLVYVLISVYTSYRIIADSKLYQDNKHN